MASDDNVVELHPRVGTDDEKSVFLYVRAPEVLNGGGETSAFFNRSERWIHTLMSTDPKVPIRKLPTGGLIALRDELLAYIRHLPLAGKNPSKR